MHFYLKSDTPPPPHLKNKTTTPKQQQQNKQKPKKTPKIETKKHPTKQKKQIVNNPDKESHIHVIDCKWMIIRYKTSTYVTFLFVKMRWHEDWGWNLKSGRL